MLKRIFDLTPVTREHAHSEERPDLALGSPKLESKSGSLRIKSYYTATVDEAMRLAIKELGADAMLIQSRRTPEQFRSRGAYEVVFGLTPEPAEEDLDSGEETGLTTKEYQRPPAAAPETYELDQPSEPRQAGAQGAVCACTSVAPRTARMISLLEKKGLDSHLATDLVEAACSTIPAAVSGESQQAALVAAVAAEISSRISVDWTLGSTDGSSGVVVVVGPPGAGKTTTLMKLIAQYGWRTRLPKHVISLRGGSPTGGDHLSKFAATHGIGFTSVDGVETLDPALADLRSKAWLFVDTPGFAMTNLDEAVELAKRLNALPEADIHLVLPLWMRDSCLASFIDKFEIFNPKKLLFTRLDDVTACSTILREAIRTRKPVSYFGTGSAIPADIEPASKERIVAMAFGESEHLLVRRHQLLLEVDELVHLLKDDPAAKSNGYQQ